MIEGDHSHKEPWPFIGMDDSPPQKWSQKPPLEALTYFAGGDAQMQSDG